MTELSAIEDLVQQAKDGDVQAFGILYDRTFRLVRAVAADAGPDAADDVTHEAYLRLTGIWEIYAIQRNSQPGW